MATSSYGAIASNNMNSTGVEWADAASVESERNYNRNQASCPGVAKCCCIGIVLVALTVVVGSSYWQTNPPPPVVEKTAASLLTQFSKPQKLAMPHGVNVGSWLSLEDYFFAGNSAVEVATPDDKIAAVCLPPLHLGASTGPTWHSETDLFRNLTKSSGVLWAIRVFHAHRTTFLDFDQDLAQLADLGIQSIRVPISWCLTDEDPAKDIAMDNNPTTTTTNDDEALLEERFTCQDPFFEEVRWPAGTYSNRKDCSCGLFLFSTK